MDELLCFKVLLKFHGRGLLTQNERKMLVFLNFTEERGGKNPEIVSFLFLVPAVLRVLSLATN